MKAVRQASLCPFWACGILLAATPGMAVAQYTIGQVGTDADSIYRVAGINNSGVVAGDRTIRPGDSLIGAPWRWTQIGGIEILPTFGTTGQGEVSAINALGVCVGWASNNNWVRYPAYWNSTGSITNLGGRFSYEAFGLSDLPSPIVAGQDMTRSARPPAYFLGSKWTELPSPNGRGYACGADEQGRIVGIVLEADGSVRVALWTKNAKGKYVLTDLTATKGLAAPGEPGVPGSPIIRNGKVASGGKVLDLAGGVITDLSATGYTGIAITALNSAGQAVGYYDKVWNPQPGYLSYTRPFYWDGAALLDLNDLVASSGWVLESATGMNDQGQIVGMGSYGGTRKAYTLDLTP